MASRTPYTGTAVAGDVYTAAHVNELPAGLVAYVSITSNSAAFTTAADVSGLSITYTFVDGRMYRARLTGLVGSDVSGDVIKAIINTTDTGDATWGEVTVTADNNSSLSAEYLFTASGSKTVKVRGARASGSGTCTLKATASAPFYLLIYDDGPSF